MTAWKIWPLPQSGTPRARVTAPLWPKTESSWVELSEAGTDDDYRSGGGRADRSRETARPCAGALGLPLPERTLRDRESEQNHEEGDRRRGLPARGGFHRIRRALSQFCGRCGGLRRRQRARFGFEHRIRPRHENRSLANRG